MKALLRIALMLVVGVGLSACGSSSTPGDSITLLEESTTPSVSTASGLMDDSALPTAAHRLVFQDAGRVHVAMSDGSDSMDVASAAPNDQEHPDWSRDGARLVFETGFSTLWVVDADGTDLQRSYECVAPCSSLQDGAWSPDAREIAFVVAETEDGTTTSRSAIVSLDVASGNVRTIYEDSSGRVWLRHPRWSGNGESVVFEEDTFASDLLTEATVTNLAIKVVSAAGGAVPDNVVEWAGPAPPPGSPDPDWSSIDDLIVFSRGDNLFTVKPDGTEETQLTQFDAVTEHAIQPTFTPDGTGIVFTFFRGQFGLDDVPNAAFVDLDGAGLTSLGGTIHMTHTRIRP